MKNKFIHYGVVLCLIAGVSAGILAYVNGKTKPIIEANNQKIENEARKKVLPLAMDFDISNTIKTEKFEFIPGYNENKEVVGYIAKGSSGGYGGKIEFLIGMDQAGKLTGLSVLSHSETPDLGSKITGEKWQESWIGRDKTYEFNKSVDAFAGATISPKAVYTGIKEILTTFESEVKK